VLAHPVAGNQATEMSTAKNNVLMVPVIIVLLAIIGCRKPAEYAGTFSRLDNRVIDSSNVLSTEQKDHLFQMIQVIEDSTGAQIAVVVIQSLKGRDLNKYSLQVAEHLSLGRYGYNDGVLLTIALEEGKARIEVGTGLEKTLSDETSARILNGIMIPEFQEGKVFIGLRNGILQIGEIVHRHDGSRP